MGAGRALGLSNQFFQGPQAGGAMAPQGQVMQPLSPAQQAAMTAFQGSPAQQMAAANARNPNFMANAASAMGRPGAPGQGPGGQKAGGGAGMPPQMQQQIAGLPGGPSAAAPGAPPPGPPGGPPQGVMSLGRRPGAPAAGPGGQKAPGMQKQIAQLPGGPR